MLPLEAFPTDKRRSDGRQSRCRSCCNLLQNARYRSLSPEQREALNTSARAWVERNKEKVLARAKEYYRTHKEVHSKRVKRWLESNRDSFNAYLRDKSKNDKRYNLRKRLSQRLRTAVGGKKNGTVLSHCGCSLEELLLHLGHKPCVNAHIDHICPLAQAQNEEEIYKLFHYSNLRWLPPTENIKKKASKTEEGERLCLTLLGREWED
jgi:hypothetical protein